MFGVPIALDEAARLRRRQPGVVFWDVVMPLAGPA